MENNRLNNIKNENWIAMNAILDKEMPTKKRRTGLYIWLLTFGLVGSATSLYFYPSSVELKNRGLAPMTKPDVLKSNIYVSAESNIQYNSKEKSKVEINKIRTKTKAVHTSENILETSDDNSRKAMEATIAIRESEGINSNTPETKGNSNQKEIEVLLVENSISDGESKLQFIPSIDAKKIEFNSRKLEFPEVTNHHKSLYKMGLIGSGATTGFKSLSSFYIGINGERKINKSLSAYANIGWRQFIGSNLNIQKETNKLYENTNSSTIVNPALEHDLNQIIISDITKTLNYIELTTGVNYEVSSWITLQGGITLGSLLNESYHIKEETRDYYKDLSKDAEYDVFVANIDEVTYHRKLISHINIGFEVRLNNTLSLFSSTHRFMNSSSFDKNIKIYNQPTNKFWGELGLKYNFVN